jgi:alkanesulfonate monooxygenase SsuD/methylene tetrahydromethanopterin reductase-like flavin-dependent oxidoreductase (luciferase family)
MRFGHFLFHTNMDPSRDAEAVQNALAEARLAEELEYDALWFSEHNFSGEVGYSDALVMAAAVAMQTKRIPLGFAVLELALHHPVRVAVQTALLDNLCQGRLLVGLARGSAYSAFEFRGFGTSVKEGIERTKEAEDLLVKAWTAEDGLEYNGEYWQVAFPRIRPRPYQKPHPPLFRAAVSPESITDMAKIGRPVLLRTKTAPHATEQLTLYRDVMASSGFDEETVERTLDRCWVWRDIYISDSNEQAMEEFAPGFEHFEDEVGELRRRWSPADQPVTQRVQRMLRENTDNPLTSTMIIGSLELAKERFAELRDAGVRNILMTHRGEVVTAEQGTRSMHLLAEKVFPYFR